MFNDKTLDLDLEEGASLVFSLKLESETEVCTTHPITGENTNCHTQSAATDISGGSFSGGIVVNFGDAPVVSFTLTKEGTGAAGIVFMELTQPQVQTIADLVRPNYSLNNNKRLRNVGHYDVTYSAEGMSTRIMEGKVTMSLGS
jgi:hypothetical protein